MLLSGDREFLSGAAGFLAGVFAFPSESSVRRVAGGIFRLAQTGARTVGKTCARAGNPVSSAPMKPFSLPANYPRVRRVDSFAALVGTPFGAGVNALVWERELVGDFQEVVDRLGPGAGIVTLAPAALRQLPISAAGRRAIDVMLADWELLRAQDLAPALNCIHAYPREAAPGPVPTDVLSFHADSAPVEADTWLCTYHGPPSEGLRNEEARRRVDIPATRAELLRCYGGPDDAGFADYLQEHCYDLHYAAEPGAQLFSFGHGNLWRIATEWPGSPVPPCIHRAPEQLPGQPPRLLLIS